MASVVLLAVLVLLLVVVVLLLLWLLWLVVVVVVAGGGHRELARHRRMKAAEYSESNVQSRQVMMHRGRFGSKHGNCPVSRLSFRR